MATLENYTCDKLTIGYGSKVICRNLSLNLFSGELVCLLGQNGVGKSTLIKTMAGLLPPLGGDILVNGNSLSSLTRPEIAQKISVVTTEKISAAGLSVIDVLLTGRFPHLGWYKPMTSSDLDILNQAVAMTRIEYLVDKKMGELSDGQRQKVMIARALTQDGNIIFLDEPTAHLDLVNRIEIARLLRQIATEQKKSIVISTHELNLAVQFADKLVLMDFGRPLKVGTPEDLIISGELNDIFHHTEFDYDLVTNKITFPDKSDRKIEIKANSELTHWILNAISRVKMQNLQNVMITAEKVEKVVEWEVDHAGNTYKGTGMNELIAKLIALE